MKIFPRLQELHRRIKDIITKHPVFFVFVIAMLVTVARKPDIVLNAQLWAEDGTIWLAQMYNLGPQSLLDPQNGYYQSVSRASAFVALLFPLSYVPLVMNLCFVVIKSSLVAVIWSSRLAHILTSWRGRLFVSAVILLFPVLQEVHGNVTNIHWYLGLYALVVFFLTPPKALLGKTHDVSVIALAALSGPFVIFWLSCAGLLWLARVRELKHWHTLLIIVSLVCLIPQAYAILSFSGVGRVDAYRGASIERFVQIVGTRISGHTILGEEAVLKIWNNPHYYFSFFSFFMITIAYCLIRGSIYLRLVILYGFMLLAASLYSPMVPDAPDGQWSLLGAAGAAQRYFVVPIIIFSLCLGYAFSASKYSLLRFSFAAVLVLLMTTWARDFSIEAYSDQGWKHHIDEFEELPSETSYSIPINPQNWKMDIIKK